MSEAWVRRILSAAAAATYLFLYAPIALIVLFSFNAGRSGLSFECCSVQWFGRAFGNPFIIEALGTSALIAFCSAVLATLFGTLAVFGLQRVGKRVRLFFDADPGRIYEATITEIPKGVGQGQIAVSGTLARVGSIGGTGAYPAVISIPQNADRSILRLGTSGTATVFSETAGAIGLIAHILLWIQSYVAYL